MGILMITPERPCWAVYEDSVINENGRVLRPGVYWHSYKETAADFREASEGSKNRRISDEWIATPITVIARTINSDNGSAGRLLRLLTESGPKEWTIAMEVFGGSGEEVRRALFAMGAIIALKKRSAFMEYLLEQHPSEVIATTSRLGWHESGAFVLPDRTIGNSNVRFQSSQIDQLPFRSNGELVIWQHDVAAKCVGNPVLTLAVGISLAGPLLSLLSILGGGIHLIGRSSSGKTLAQLIGASIWGNPEVFIVNWNVTPGGLEIAAKNRNDTFLPLDEISQADANHLQEMVYTLANGHGKTTMTRERAGRDRLSWRLLSLSSGEHSLSEHAVKSGSSTNAGANLRLVDVNAGLRKYRAFDELHGLSGAEFHHRLSVSVGSHYGHLGPAFVEMLVGQDRIELLKEFADLRANFVSDNSQAGRVADRFAVIAFAGEKAITFGLLPWLPGTALADCQKLYGEWLCKAGESDAEDRKVLNGIQDFIDRHGSSRFSALEDKTSDIRVMNRAGYWQQVGENRHYLFYKSALIEAAGEHNLPRIIKALEGAKALALRDNERNTKNYRLAGGEQVRLYVVNPRAFDLEPKGAYP